METSRQNISVSDFEQYVFARYLWKGMNVIQFALYIRCGQLRKTSKELLPFNCNYLITAPSFVDLSKGAYRVF